MMQNINYNYQYLACILMLMWPHTMGRLQYNYILLFCVCISACLFSMNVHFLFLIFKRVVPSFRLFPFVITLT